MDNRPVSVEARATIAAPAGDIFGLLADLDRHRDLTDRGMRILALHGPAAHRTGGLVELRGPMGVRRVARTRVQGAEPHSRLWGTAVTRDGAQATLQWRVQPDGERTHVEVRLDVQAAGWRDRLLLHLGGRAWLWSRLRAALDRLAQITQPQTA